MKQAQASVHGIPDTERIHLGIWAVAQFAAHPARFHVTSGWKNARALAKSNETFLARAIPRCTTREPVRIFNARLEERTYLAGEDNRWEHLGDYVRKSTGTWWIAPSVVASVAVVVAVGPIR